ncbi:MAG: GMC family oxidoreductase, partial [Paludibacter sp.]
KGIGNENGWVGHNMQAHAYTSSYGIFAEDNFDDLGPGASVAICDFSHHNKGIIGGGMLANEFIPLPYQFASYRPHNAPMWGKEHKMFQRQNYKRLMRINGPNQEIPVFESMVDVDPTVKDFWGIPVARLSGTRHARDVEGCQLMSDKAELWLKEAGAVYTWQSVGGTGMAGGQHQAGTCRMGNDPNTSVTDKWGRIHGVPNVFVADGSLHVNNGGFNPVLTIMALGYRVGGFIASEWLKGNRFK